MLVKPDQAETAAFARIQRTAEWEVIESYLQRCREVAVTRSLSIDGSDMYRYQGVALAIDALNKTARDVAAATVR